MDFGLCYAMVGLGLWGRCVSYARQQISYHMHARTAYYMHAKHVHIIWNPKSIFEYQYHEFSFFDLAYYLYAFSWDRLGSDCTRVPNWVLFLVCLSKCTVYYVNGCFDEYPCKRDLFTTFIPNQSRFTTSPFKQACDQKVKKCLYCLTGQRSEPTPWRHMRWYCKMAAPLLQNL